MGSFLRSSNGENQSSTHVFVVQPYSTCIASEADNGYHELLFPPDYRSPSDDSVDPDWQVLAVISVDVALVSSMNKSHHSSEVRWFLHHTLVLVFVN
jgi:hypothetical protein